MKVQLLMGEKHSDRYKGPIFEVIEVSLNFYIVDGGNRGMIALKKENCEIVPDEWLLKIENLENERLKIVGFTIINERFKNDNITKILTSNPDQIKPSN